MFYLPDIGMDYAVVLTQHLPPVNDVPLTTFLGKDLIALSGLLSYQIGNSMCFWNICHFFIQLFLQNGNKIRNISRISINHFL